MNKKVLLVISTDWHIKIDNFITELIYQKIELAKQLNINRLVCLGDIFHSRQAQPLSVLKHFESILDSINENKMKLYCIPGNHCKTDYLSSDSFLDPFINHPSMNLYKDIDMIDLNDFKFWFLPYFEENLWRSKLESIIKSIDRNKKNILFSHQAVTGSINNDNSKVSNSINSSDLNCFYKVFLGHYHNQQKIGDNIYHLPAIKAHNFGEDNEKGFTVFYNDGSHELVKSNFKEYHKIVVNLDSVNQTDLNYLKKQAEELKGKANLRFELVGEQDKLNSFNKEEFEDVGVSITKKHKSVVKSIEKTTSNEVVIYNKSKILDKFDEFCDQENVEDSSYGKNCLIKKLGI